MEKYEKPSMEVIDLSGENVITDSCVWVFTCEGNYTPQ